MKLLQKLLLPFSLIYWAVTSLRNFMYNLGVLRSYEFSLPVIVIGNLSTGGTGKSPMAEYLVRLLVPKYRVATLSRGYKRKSKGFILADASANADTLGDEPYQFYHKFSNISVAVDADRKNGIEQLQQRVNPQVIVMDDAYQHRRVKAGFYILLTAYNDLYADDYVLPAGNLREGRAGAKRADIIVVTKCPPDLSDDERNRIRKKLNPAQGQQLFFTFIAYDEVVYSAEGHLPADEVRNMPKVLVAGIAKPRPFIEHLKGRGDVVLTYPDHHNFTEKDIADIQQQGKIVVTTEKDYMRLMGRLPAGSLYYLPIRTSFISGGDNFNNTVLNYVEKSSGSY